MLPAVPVLSMLMRLAAELLVLLTTARPSHQACCASHSAALGPARAAHSSSRPPSCQPTVNSQVSCLRINTAKPTAVATVDAATAGSTAADAASMAPTAGASTDATLLPTSAPEADELLAGGWRREGCLTAAVLLLWPREVCIPREGCLPAASTAASLLLGAPGFKDAADGCG